jgi:hypothetical protein
VGASSHHHHLLDPKTKGDFAHLSDHGHTASYFPRRKGGKVTPKKARGARMWPKRPGEDPQERRLTRAVGTYHDDELARMQGEAEVSQDLCGSFRGWVLADCIPRRNALCLQRTDRSRRLGCAGA